MYRLVQGEVLVDRVAHRLGCGPPFTRSEEADQHLVRFVERGTSLEEVEDEARAIVAEWLQIATREGVRHEVPGAI